MKWNLDFYKSLIRKFKKLHTVIQRWAEIYGVKEDEWENIFRFPEIELQAFEYANK